VYVSASISSRQREFVRREFDRARSYAAEYAELSPIGHFFRTRLRRVDELLGDFTEGRVLDCGCGPAIVSTLFRGKQIDYYGIDLSSAMLRTATASRESDSHRTFLQGGIESLPFRNNSFQAVLCLGALEYALDAPAVLHEMARVVSAGGTVVITMLNPGSPYRLWGEYGWGRIARLPSQIKRVLTPAPASSGSPSRPVWILRPESELRRLCEDAGLAVDDVLYYDFEILPAPLDRLFPRAAAWLADRCESQARGLLRSLGSGYAVKCRKR
jgi:SAM-dependent methyltransferase